MLYVDRIDGEKNEVYLYDTDLKHMYTVRNTNSKIKTCENYKTTGCGYYVDILGVPTTQLLLYNSENAIALVQIKGGNRILYVYVNGYLYEIAFAGAQIVINYEVSLRLRSGVSDVEFRYMYKYRGCDYYGITLVNTNTLDIYQFKFDKKGIMYNNGEELCTGTEVNINTFRRMTLFII